MHNSKKSSNFAASSITIDIVRNKIHIIFLLFCTLVACSRPTAESYYEQGKQFREAGDPVAAVECFMAATRTYSREYSIKGRAYSNMATMCRMAERHDIAYGVYALSAEQFAKAADTLAYAYALNNMAWEQAVQGQKEEALCLVDSAVRLCPEEAVQEKVLESRSAACLYAEEYDSVLYYTQGVQSVYFDILRAQAYTFLETYDSALFYAQRVLEQTDNPRYLDDVYYILTHCDSTATVEVLRELSSSRTDVQRSLERNDPAWTQAMLMAEDMLTEQSHSSRRGWIIVLCLGVFAILVGAGWYFFYRTKATAQDTTEVSEALDQACRSLRRSAQLRTDLQWYDYAQFRTICNTQLAGIVDKLEVRGLSEREIRLCVLVLIGLSYAEIAEILYRAESGIGKDKYVVAKHLGVRVKDLRTTLRSIACKNNHA